MWGKYTIHIVHRAYDADKFDYHDHSLQFHHAIFTLIWTYHWFFWTRIAAGVHFWKTTTLRRISLAAQNPRLLDMIKATGGSQTYLSTAWLAPKNCIDSRCSMHSPGPLKFLPEVARKSAGPSLLCLKCGVKTRYQSILKVNTKIAEISGCSSPW